MRILPLALMLLATGAAADVVQPAARCARGDRVQMAAGAHDAPGFRRLDQLPPAAEYLAVYRRLDRCPAPVIVRYNIGAPRR